MKSIQSDFPFAQMKMISQINSYKNYIESISTSNQAFIYRFRLFAVRSTAQVISGYAWTILTLMLSWIYITESIKKSLIKM